MYYAPSDHFTNIEAIISYDPTSQNYVSSGVDCHRQINYQLTDSDKTFLEDELPKLSQKSNSPFGFLSTSSDSEIIFCHLKIQKFHFFLVFLRKNYASVQLQMNDIIEYFRTKSGDFPKDMDTSQKSNELLMNFNVNQSEAIEMCDKCKTQGICAPKYLNSIFQSIAKV